MPEFCRHNRFVERCPICSKDLPGAGAGPGAARRAGGAGAGAKDATAKRGARSAAAGRARRPAGLRVYADGAPRAREDGYSCELVPGLRSSEDARRLAAELGFSGARLSTLASSPPGSYGEASALAQGGEIERAILLCFLTAYLSPVEGDLSFATIQRAFAAVETGGIGSLDLDALPFGPRTSHRPGDGLRTLLAYESWSQRAGSQAQTLAGDPAWSAERRFARAFERLSIPGLSRAARFELLVSLGNLGLLELTADSLHLHAATSGSGGAARGDASADPVLTAGKRIFGIGDALTLERRAAALADACATSIDALDLALFNWASPERATLGIPDEDSGDELLEVEALTALGL